MIRALTRSLLAFALVLPVSCADGDTRRMQDEIPAEVALANLEARLLAARDVGLAFRATSEGAFDAALTGALRLAADDRVALDASGSFGGRPVDLHLVADPGETRGGRTEAPYSVGTPPDLADALVVGLVRMGILHNLARLVTDLPPERAEGGVRDWVRAVDVEWVEVHSPPEGAVAGLAFGVEVAGERTAEAVLWLDDEGLPAHRTQVVTFPGGTMQVVEEFEILSFDP
jgi:hypothetical protein